MMTETLLNLLMQEGFAFSHCTTCKAQFHLRVEFPEDYSWRKIKFRLFVARDVILVFLSVQTVRINDISLIISRNQNTVNGAIFQSYLYYHIFIHCAFVVIFVFMCNCWRFASRFNRDKSRLLIRIRCMILRLMQYFLYYHKMMLLLPEVF
jgi:hypothetical protein